MLLDSGTSNLLSVQRALDHVGADVVIADQPSMLDDADRLILPGVGAFGHCVANLIENGLFDAVLDYARRERPLLGICVGMQMLFDGSEEFGWNDGLGLLPGRVQPIPMSGADGGRHKIPHIGWATLERSGPDWAGTFLEGFGRDRAVYFVHSFSARPEAVSDILAFADYDGIQLTAAVRRDNIMGTQFHPEKSGQAGLGILSRFLSM